MSEFVSAQPDIRIGPLDPVEGPALIDFAVQAHGDTYNDHMLPADLLPGAAELWRKKLEYIDPDDTILVAKLAGGIVGYTQFGDGGPDMSSDSKELRKLYVAKELIGQGIGRRLMEAALASPVLKPASSMHLWVWGGNERAIRFYKTYGFRETSARHYDLPNGPTRDVMMVRHSSSHLL